VKVLVTAVPQGGDAYPLVPLITAFVEQGHEVVFATGPEGGEFGAGTGARAASVGGGMAIWWQTLAARTRGTPGDGLPPERIMQYFVPRLFAEVGAADMVDDLLGLARNSPLT
jgi:hypothetical protein